MELLIPILMGFIVLSTALKVSLYAQWKTILWVAVAASGFAYLCWPIAVAGSRTQIADSLSSPLRMREAAVAISLEVALWIAFCFTHAVAPFRRHATKPQRLCAQFLAGYPGLLVGVVILFGLTQSIYAFPGKEFQVVAGGYALAVFLLGPGAVALLRFLLPDESLRLELLFLASLFTLTMGIITTVNGETTYQVVSNVDGRSTWLTLAQLVAGAAIGFISHFIHFKRK